MASKIIACVLLIGLLFVSVRPLHSSLKKIDQSAFGRNLLDTIDIQLSSGQAVQSLIQLLEELRASLEQEQADHSSRHIDYQDQCTGDLQELDDQISQTENDYNNAVATLADLNNQLEDTITQLSTTNDELDAEEAFLTAITDARNAEHATFLERSTEHEAAIEAVQNAAGKVATLYSAQSASFLEHSAKSAHKQILAQISTSLKKAGKVPGYTPIIKFIGQVADIETNPDFGFPRESVARLQGLLDRLTQLLRDSYEDILRNEQNASAAFEEIRAATEGKIGELEAKVHDLEGQQSALEGDISTWTTTRDNLATSLEAYRQERDDRQAQCDAEAANYESETTRRTEEISIVDQVTRIVQSKISTMKDYLTARVEANVEASA